MSVISHKCSTCSLFTSYYAKMSLVWYHVAHGMLIISQRRLFIMTYCLPIMNIATRVGVAVYFCSGCAVW